MVNLKESSFVFIPLKECPLAYRFTDERYNRLDRRTRSTIRPLDDDSGIRLADAHGLAKLAWRAERNALPPDWDVHTIDEADLDRTRCWLRRLRPGADDDVYVEWSLKPSCAAVVAWSTVCTYFDDFWYEFEKMLVCDDTRGWQLLFGPNGHARWRAPTASIEAFPHRATP